MKPILEIQNLSKTFRILHDKQSYLSLRDSISSIFKSSTKTTEEFYALKDVSFNVNPGESIGIIGKNGAGKSTLLKILSKITPLSFGKIISRGRIASLLEVGTGFHPELSGRENVFLNGSILGMKKTEILKNFDEIVDFAGVENFIDTPLKHYSSGMQLRLAFAVAAYLENEILIIDEVLAVGDAEFQKKCMGKMDDVSKSGRTVLFVSHNMAAVKKLCSKGILLANGMLNEIGNIETVSQKYVSNFSENSDKFKDFSKFKNKVAFTTKVSIENLENVVLNTVPVGSFWQIRINFTIEQPTPHFMIGIGFKTIEDTGFRTIWNSPQDLNPGEYEAVLIEDSIHYGVGKYKLNLGFSSRTQAIYYMEDAILLEFEDHGDSNIALRSDAGIILNQLKSTTKKIN